MKFSQFLAKTIRQEPKDEVSLNAKLLIKSGYVDKLMAGVYSLLPLGLVVCKKIEQIIREEINNIGGQEMLLPALQPKENWVITDRWANMDDLFQLKTEENRELALGPTHEEVIVPLAKRFVSSYKDLPLYLYQFQNKFRNEKRAKSGLLRGREFIMKDLYSFHTDENDLNDYYEKAKVAYQRIFARCGIGDKTYFTYASGGTFSRYSHEFQTLTEAGEDIIHICDACRVAVNKEIIEELNNKCPECGRSELRPAKSVEVGNIFKLMTKFSHPFELTYDSADGRKNEVIMGCYGIGLQRLMGTIVETSNDEKGIIWPREVSPFFVHLVELKSANEMVKIRTEEIYYSLKMEGIETLYDDREEASAGEKFTDADLIGCPCRLIISERTIADDSAELKMRQEKDSQNIKISELTGRIKELNS